MKLIVGLGNPGRKYEGTRHNVGFAVVEELARRSAVGRVKLEHKAETVEAAVGSERLLLVCPQTFMNNSGQSVRKFVDFYKLELDRLLIVCDDMNLDAGAIRLRAKGSCGGQNGLRDVARQLASEEFARLRIGIGRPPGEWSSTDYVLGKFTRGEQPVVDDAIVQAVEAASDWAEHGIDQAMNRHNRRRGEA
jgi:PTH1 family peptidyl-tRNA hydrolase